MARQFIAEIEPYFHARPVVYVDAGAHVGKVFAEFAAGLALREAHLIEPNPSSFALLQQRAAEISDSKPGIKLLRTHNLALGAAQGRVRMTDADTMSRVVDPAAGIGDFEVECTTLDRLAEGFEARHVSILKIDVEGYEPQVLEGAAGLLARGAIDTIYIEAGMNPEGWQQSYYRQIEDRLAAHGYKLFGIYEQKHEWREDSPLLRRANLGFMSAQFAASNPRRLSRELFALRKDHAALKDAAAREADAAATKLAEALARAASLRAEADAAHAAAEQAQAALQAAAQAAQQRLEASLAREQAARRAAVEQAEAHLADLGASLRAETARAEAAETARTAALAESRAARARLAPLLAYGRDLEKKYADLLASSSWRALEPARWLSRRLRNRRPPAPFVPQLSGKGFTAAGGRFAGAKPKSGAKSDSVRLEDKLWGGFSQTALRDLEALKTAPGTRKGELIEVAWILARWYGAHDDYPRAYENALLMRSANPGKPVTIRGALLEAECLRQMGKPERARDLIAGALERLPGDPDLCLAMANSFQPVAADPDAPDAAGDAIRLDWINRIYGGAGLLPLAPLDPARGLVIDNLATQPAATPAAEGPKVSVIMPVYEAAATLPFALRGLLAQSWTNLEILIVDDCSPDDTVAVAEAIAATDPRITVLRQTENRGAYAARNAALALATGDFVTTHDADDWSHPQKIELQVTALMAGDAGQGNHSCWIRCSRDMTFRGLFRPWRRLISKNVSSIMLPRQMLVDLGGWVEARVGADSELMRRWETVHGRNSLRAIAFEGPLSFSLHEERSLTRQSATHVRTVFHGVRKEFHDAGEYWRRSLADPAELRLEGARQPFPIPGVIRPERAPLVTCDLVFITDLAMGGGAFESSLNYVEAALAAGLSVAVFHWRRYDLDIEKPINPRIRAMAQSGRLRILAAGEKVQTGTVIIGYPVILRWPLDALPEIRFDDLVVVVNQMASRLQGGGDPQYDPEDLRANLREAFGSEGIWAPISGLVQRLMRADPRYPAPSETIWTPLIDTANWCETPPQWHGGPDSVPVIGRHGRDHYTKWPSNAEALAAAYCVGRPARVEILGDAAMALKVLGTRQPSNWTVHPFGAMGARKFLSRLDFFVHYPHEDYIEEFGRAVLEALATGVPAILPPVFEQTFGAAALYAEPDGVWDTISRLWADEAAYLAQARAGQDFVRASSDWSQFPARLAATLGADRPAAEQPRRVMGSSL